MGIKLDIKKGTTPEGRYISYEINNNSLRLVCDGSYQLNIDTNKVSVDYNVH